MQIVKEEKGKTLVIEAAEKQIFSGIAAKILKVLAEEDRYPKEIARELRIHDQKIYYHVKQLEKKGFIRVARREERGGAMAKIYELSSPAFFTRFGEFRETKRVPRASSLDPFIKNGRLNAKIIVGSTEPHGPEKARSRDVSFVVDLGLFFGTLLTHVDSSVVEDKDMHKHDLTGNLIIVGGPVTNKITKMVNDKLPVKFDTARNIFSKKTRKHYKRDDCGFIVRTENPFDTSHKIMVIAGKRFSGTRAAVITFLKHFSEIEKRSSVIVEGVDNDGDGEIDDVKILE
jgi:DNA-binding transcriptional ArsR family regulator